MKKVLYCPVFSVHFDAILLEINCWTDSTFPNNWSNYYKEVAPLSLTTGPTIPKNWTNYPKELTKLTPSTDHNISNNWSNYPQEQTKLSPRIDPTIPENWHNYPEEPKKKSKKGRHWISWQMRIVSPLPWHFLRGIIRGIFFFFKLR